MNSCSAAVEQRQHTLSQKRVKLATPPADLDTATSAAMLDSGNANVDRITLKQRVMQAPTIPPQPSAAHKRLMDLHVTGYPNNINRDLLPDHAKAMTDFTEIDPTRYRQNHTVKNENASTLDAASLAEQKQASASNGRDESMMSTSQVAARLAAMGVQIRQAHEHERMMHGSQSPNALRAAMVQRGFQSKNYNPTYDGRSTYRMAYDKDEDYTSQDSARRSHLTHYRSGWTDDQKADIDASMRQPFLTQPVSALKGDRFRTVYRARLIPEAGEQDFRLLSHNTHLSELGTAFAYSAYACDDVRRDVSYNAAIASLKDPHSALEESYVPTATTGGLGVSTLRGASNAHDELERMREMRRQTLQRSTASRQVKPETVEDIIAARDGSAVVLPGVRGNGYRRAPGGKSDYIFLPRDTFSQRPIDDI